MPGMEHVLKKYLQKEWIFKTIEHTNYFFS